jgi:hypothetical protein
MWDQERLGWKGTVRRLTPVPGYPLRVLLIFVAACALSLLPGCEDRRSEGLFWRLSNKTALFAAIAAVCVVVIARRRRT